MTKTRKRKVTEEEVRDLVTEALLKVVSSLEKKFGVRIRFNIDGIKILK